MIAADTINPNQSCLPTKVICILDSNQGGQVILITQSPDFFKDVSIHVLFHVKFGCMGCCDFSTNNPQNTCLE